MSHRIDMAGQSFDRLTVVREDGRIRKEVAWICVCVCGKNVRAAGNQLRSGKTRSCGCLLADTNVRLRRTHGMHESPEYQIWSGMIKRCTCPSVNAYSRYGGRGISVCARWAAFDLFFADMGPRPSPDHSIDRIDNDGNYEPGNCRWATRAEQARNTRATRRVRLAGALMVQRDAARLLGVSPTTITRMVQRGELSRE